MSEWLKEHAWKTCLVELRLPPTQEVAGFWRPLAVSGRAQHSSAAFRSYRSSRAQRWSGRRAGIQAWEGCCNRPDNETKGTTHLTKEGDRQDSDAVTRGCYPGSRWDRRVHARRQVVSAHAHCLSMAGGL